MILVQIPLHRSILTLHLYFFFDLFFTFIFALLAFAGLKRTFELDADRLKQVLQNWLFDHSEPDVLLGVVLLGNIFKLKPQLALWLEFLLAGHILAKVNEFEAHQGEVVGRILVIILERKWSFRDHWANPLSFGY